MKQRGSILMISLWILAILVVFAIGLGNRCMINLKLARSQKESLTTSLLAQAGMQKAVVLLSQEATQPAKDYDSLSDPWSTGIDPDTKAYILKEVELKKGSGEKFTVGFFDENNHYYCMTDEERKINLNSASPACLAALFEKFGIDTGANELINYILYWRSDPGLDAKTVFLGLKKDRFSNCEELGIVLEYFYKNKTTDYQKKAQDAFKLLRDSITVYGGNALGSGAISLNINTVSRDILSIFAKSLAADADEITTAEGLIGKIINLRNSQAIKSEDEIVNGIQLSTSEVNFFNKLKSNLVYKSNYFKIESSGNSGKALKKINAVYDRDKTKFLYWHQY
ncbi:MAG: type II secretion system protein GspK [Candidatus Omnitrophica bacterium]|nr:type II secretion system protein GspK [Candidatus Omnitrophota bacterium]